MGRVPYTGGTEDAYRQSTLHWRQWGCLQAEYPTLEAMRTPTGGNEDVRVPYTGGNEDAYRQRQ